MPESETQNIAIVLDASRSMYRKDYSPNRYEICKEAIIQLIKTRMAEDPKTGFALIVVGLETKKVLGFEDFSDPDSIKTILDDIEIGGSSKISDGIGIAIKLQIEDIRKAGAKVPKILLFSDGKLTKSKVGPTKMAEIAKGLEIKIDTVRLGEVEHFNMMKRISELTDGQYYYCNDANSVLSTAVIIAESNRGKKYTKSRNFSNILEKIAVPLKTEAELNKDSADIAARIRGTASFKKCGICFMEQDPQTKSDFHISGRYCPNCGQGFHIHCVSQWANNDKDSNGRVFRCPHCFYLLKIPGEVQQAARIHEEFKRDRILQPQSNTTSQFYAKKFIAKELGDNALYSACPVCNTIFDEDEEVIKCGNPECNAIYHTDCFEQINGNSCKSCGKKLSTSF